MQLGNEMEQIICMIPGVKGARVVFEDGEVREIHVLARPDRHAKQVARDIESSLFARFQTRVEYRRISVAQIEDDQVEPRAQIDGFQTRVQQNGVDIKVELRLGDRRASGAAFGPFSERSRLALAARATLEALMQLVPEGVRLYLEGVDTLQVDQKQAVVCSVCLVMGDRHEVLPGSAYIRRDDAEASIRACLDALNRRMAQFIPA